MKQPTELLDVINLFYDAAINRERWPEALDALKEHLRFDRIAVAGYKDGTSNVRLFYDSVPEKSFWEEFERYYKYSNPINDYLKQNKDPEIIYDYKFTSEPEMARSKFYNWLEKHDAKYILGAKIATLSNGYSAAAVLRRSSRRGHATEDEIDALLFARNHVGRALMMSHDFRPFDNTPQSLETLLNISAAGIAMISIDGNITRTNEAFENLIELHDDLDISDRQLIITPPRLGQELEQKLARVIESRKDDALMRAEQLFFRPASNDIFIGIRIQHIPKRAGFELCTEDAAILLMHSSRNFSPLAIKDFAANHHLTAAETNILRSLLMGLSLDEHAERNGISIGTARWHMQNILQKTQTRNQAQLVRAVSSMLFYRK